MVLDFFRKLWKEVEKLFGKLYIKIMIYFEINFWFDFRFYVKSRIWIYYVIVIVVWGRFILVRWGL